MGRESKVEGREPSSPWIEHKGTGKGLFPFLFGAQLPHRPRALRSCGGTRRAATSSAAQQRRNELAVRFRHVEHFTWAARWTRADWSQRDHCYQVELVVLRQNHAARISN